MTNELAHRYLDFKQRLDGAGVILSYSGSISENVLFALGDALRQQMAERETDRNVTKRVFSVFVEQVQNIIRYSAEPASRHDDPEALRSGIVVVGHEQGGFFVACANMIGSASVAPLRERLDHIRELDHAGIKAYYKEMLRAPSDPDDSGGSVGLIEIARRASQPIEYDFEPVDEQATFFCLKAFI